MTAVSAITVSAGQINGSWFVDGDQFVKAGSSFGNNGGGGTVVVNTPSGASAEVGRPAADSVYGDSIKITNPQAKYVNAAYTNVDVDFSTNAAFGISAYVGENVSISFTAYCGEYPTAGNPDTRIVLNDIFRFRQNGLEVLGEVYDAEAAGKWFDLRAAFDFENGVIKCYVNGEFAGSKELPANYTYVSYININSLTNENAETVHYLDNFSVELENTSAFGVSTSIDEGAAETGISEIDVTFNREVVIDDIDNAVSVVNAMSGEPVEGVSAAAVKTNNYTKGLKITFAQPLTGNTGYNLVINGIATLFGKQESVYEYFNAVDGRIYAALNFASAYFEKYTAGAKVKFTVESRISEDMTVKVCNNDSEYAVADGKAEITLAEGENSVTAKVLDVNGAPVYTSKPIVLSAEGYTVTKNITAATGDSGPLGKSDGTQKIEKINENDPYGLCYMPDEYNQNGSVALPAVTDYKDTKILEMKVSYYFVDLIKAKSIWSMKVKHENAAGPWDGKWLNYATVDTNGWLHDGKGNRYVQLTTGQWYDFKTIVDLEKSEGIVFLNGEQLYKVDLQAYNADAKYLYIMYPRYVLGQNTTSTYGENPSVMYCDNVEINAVKYNNPDISLDISTDLTGLIREGMEVKAIVEAWMLPEGASAVLKANGEVITPAADGSCTYNAAGGKNELYAAMLDSTGNEILASETVSFDVLPKAYGEVKEYIVNDDMSSEGRIQVAGGKGTVDGASRDYVDDDAEHGKVIKMVTMPGSNGVNAPYTSSSSKNAKDYTDKIYALEIDMKFGDFNDKKEFPALKYNDSSWIVQPLVLKQDGKLYIQNNKRETSYYCDITANQWYKFKVVLYTDSKMMDVYMKAPGDADYVTVSENHLIQMTADMGNSINFIQYFNMTGGTIAADGSASTMYLDNFKVYTVVENDLSVLQSMAVEADGAKVSAMTDLNGEFSVSAKIYNLGGEENTVTAVAAVTEKATGALWALKADTVEFAKYQKDGEVRFIFADAPGNPENYEIKVFALSSFENISPLDDTVEIFE